MTEPTALNRKLFDEIMVPTYGPGEIIPVRGEGSRLWDQSGKEYIDFAGGIAVTCLGHAHPRLVAALKAQAEKLWHLSNSLTNEPALRLAKKLCECTFAEKVFFANSGAEANEAALKLARKYSADHHGPNKREIIAFNNGFHGRTLFTISVGGQPKYTEGFEPLPGGITHLPYDELDALADAISDDTCAVIMELLQGEGGIHGASKSFVQGARELCDRHQTLLIFDEVQTGAGRTGTLYAYMGLDVTPDILTTAKGLGGGIPVAAMLTATKIAQSFGIGSHGSTFGGNPLACAVAAELLDIVDDVDLLTGVQRKHDLFIERLTKINQTYGVFEELRGQGLLLGCALKDTWQGRSKDFVKAALAQGLIVLIAGPNVVRMAPSLIIPDELIEEGLSRFQQGVDTLVRAAS